jgi:hypothetical protein
MASARALVSISPDVVRRLPNVTHIGLPTSADAVYIDNTEALLPSCLAWLSTDEGVAPRSREQRVVRAAGSLARWW